MRPNGGWHEYRVGLDAMPAPPDDKILIIGGYGQVGRAVAERLARIFPERVVIAGRSLKKARSAAAEIGDHVGARAIDVLAAGEAAPLEGVGLVLVCLDQESTHFVEECLARGISYVDISARSRFLSRVEHLDGLARENRSTALLSVGVSPGLTNLLAAHARKKMERVDRIDILVELGLGDHHGKTAVEWMLDNLDAEYELKQNGRTRLVRSFADSIDFQVPARRAKAAAYSFNLSDQHVLGRTLAVPVVSSWLRFSSPVLTWLVARASRMGLARLLRIAWWRRLALWLLTHVHVGANRCAVAVRATGETKPGSETLTVWVIGGDEALMTAIVTVETVRQMLTGNPPAGVLHSDQVIALGPVIAALKRELPDILVPLSADESEVERRSDRKSMRLGGDSSAGTDL